ncbi:single-stranded-DNA-specific exonuclease RecJ [Candidatus Woesebacteria bacterium RIFCSPHIGHO2_01_FULL_39_28]|uniref:Single-stranded-DNA-specific exonuclease RecJ n=1 Tax=Candidatus Woesebacteria bacterium RIFCSPHIGHO2_01_FULL_39_28 TaxID=1802496 RepID=A0A1F7YID3_9BACT|nr:MAG: single-stranded-DNA-specific exonuclease RecJ [Candidatus Woesebacteria bacterium RIFCSPHIGHO2_01_FULL_39_28]OGM57652.1 MAG: single-stranded-DNA-specific exonuclease RecJ [Candidatus Woesebacteria bacterium RIFCSPLOWO2_01_FULL_38_20]
MKWEVLNKISKGKIVDVLLENRNLKTQEQKREFFKPTHPNDLALEKLGISKNEVKKAVERIKKAIKNNEKIIVYGDYDADGICATAILWETLYSLTKNVLPYIPERFNEGYGLNIESLKKLKEDYPDLALVITVDHGIVAHKKIDFAKELGIDVIITDHHQPEKTKPKAFAIIHTTKISGSGVAWIFAKEIKKNNQLGLELAAMGTIADQLTLIGPNRSFAKYGLEALRNTERLGLLALFRQARLDPQNVGAYEVGFIIAPRINAMGRMKHAIESLRLLCTKSKENAEKLSSHLNKTNLDRQKAVEEIVIHAKNAANKLTTKGVIVLADKSYHEGVIGLAASRLVEEFHRPAIILCKKGEIAKASARSIPGFNIIETIRKLDEFLIEGGGHPMAAGFSIETKKIEIFSQRLEEISLPLLTEDLLTKKLKIDLEVEFNQMNSELAEKVLDFEPTGLGNPAPTFVTKGVQVVEARLVGSDGKHLKLKLASRQSGLQRDSREFGAIAFNMGEYFTQLTPNIFIDIAYNLVLNEWNGNKNLELKIKDIKISS